MGEEPKPQHSVDMSEKPKSQLQIPTKKEPESRQIILNITKQDQAAKVIQANIRRYLAQENYSFMKQKRIEILFHTIMREYSILIELRVVKILHEDPEKGLKKDDIVVTAYNMSTGVHFKSLLLPQGLLSHIKSWSNILDAVNFIYPILPKILI